jgi:hypothetical protein
MGYPCAMAKDDLPQRSIIGRIVMAVIALFLVYYMLRAYVL